MYDKIDSIIEKYYHNDDEYYSSRFYDSEDNEFEIGEEIRTAFEESDISQYSVEIENCYDSCGYSCDILMVAWIGSGELKTFNLLLECM